MIETQFFFLRIDPPTLPERTSVSWNKPVLLHDAGLAEHAGDGWVPISFQVIGTHPSGDLLFAVMAQREIDSDVPDDIREIDADD